MLLAWVALPCRMRPWTDFVCSVCVRVGDRITPLDLADLRRSAGLKETDEVRANDFLLAMMIRLGKHTTAAKILARSR